MAYGLKIKILYNLRLIENSTLVVAKFNYIVICFDLLLPCAYKDTTQRSIYLDVMKGMAGFMCKI